MWSVVVSQPMRPRTSSSPRSIAAPPWSPAVVLTASPPASRSGRPLGQPGLVIGTWDRFDREGHAVVVDAAELGALAAIRPLLLDRELEGVGASGDRVALEQEDRHIERVDDVGRR